MTSSLWRSFIFIIVSVPWIKIFQSIFKSYVEKSFWLNGHCRLDVSDSGRAQSTVKKTFRGLFSRKKHLFAAGQQFVEKWPRPKKRQKTISFQSYGLPIFLPWLIDCLFKNLWLGASHKKLLWSLSFLNLNDPFIYSDISLNRSMYEFNWVLQCLKAAHWFLWD